MKDERFADLRKHLNAAFASFLVTHQLWLHAVDGS